MGHGFNQILNDVMKYELNTQYNFAVKKVVNEKDAVTFMVEIEGNIFPVKGFPEQVKGSVPSVISCRILQDKNKNAYLIQNEASYYPIIYKTNHRYVFEVVNINDDYVVLQDKYGLLHTMKQDGTNLTINEIIVRCVKVINDNNYKAHLTFYYIEPTPTEIKKDLIKRKEKAVDHPIKASTIFEYETQNTLPQNNPKVFTPMATNDTTQIKENDLSQPAGLSISDMLSTKRWDLLENYLDQHLKGIQIPNILKEIASMLSSHNTSISYWEIVRFLINYDAHIFLATLSGVGLSYTLDGIDRIMLNDIITKSFACTDKLNYALNLVKPCKDLLTETQKNYIITKCASLKNCDDFYTLFKLLSLSPDEATNYLINNYNNPAAVYTLYTLYLKAIKGSYLGENSIAESFRHSKIKEYCSILERTKMFPAVMAANLIKKEILGIGTYPFDLKRKIEKNGFIGFQQFVTVKMQKDNVKNAISSINKGDILNKLSFIKEIDNYYVFVEKQMGVTTLLAKNLTTKVPAKNALSQAKIVNIKRRNQRLVYLVSQKASLPAKYRFPELVNISTILNVDFSKGNNATWYPVIKGYTNLLKVKIENIPFRFNYKARHKIKVVRRENFFTCIGRLID